ncbi:MAG TPA: hypothetical protein PK867_19610 [Pirellulales bacterium]|nr:hypothetical protein [Pirellulales bacterium]
MNFYRPWIRFRRLRSEQFQQGYLHRVRHYVSFEFGARHDLRSEVSQLKREVARLAAELARQRAVAAMARPAASKPIAAPRPAPLPPAREPAFVARRLAAADDAESVIVLIADKSWP